MNTIPQIKIIKFAERVRQAEERVAQKLTPTCQIKQVKTPDTATTIKGWIDELRLLKPQNTEMVLRNFKSLFEEAK